MPFNTALTSGDYTKLRNKWYGEQFVLIAPNTSVFQCQPLADSVGVYGEIEYTGVTIGAFGDTLAGMAYIVTDSPSDFSNVLFRGRIRKTATSTFLFVNETGFELTTSHYITVINTYDIAPKIARTITGSDLVLIDYDVSFQQLPPMIKDLQSAYVVNTTGASASISFTPDAIATASGATISSWLWDLDDGTATVGTINDQNITVSFPSGHRFVRLTVTDSNGVSNFMVFEVYVVDLSNPSSLPANVYRVTSCDISASADTGYNASVSIRESITVLDESRITIVTIDNYNGDTAPIATNIDFVGYLKREDNSISANDLSGYESQTTFQCNGYYEQLANVSVSSMLIADNDAPNTWGQAISPTPTRAVTFLMAYLTSYSNLSAVNFDTSLDNYITSQYFSAEKNATSAIEFMLSSVNARMNFAPSGETSIDRMAVYLSSSDRNTLTTVANIEEQDYFDVSFQREYGIVIGAIEGAGSVYSTTSNDEAILFSRAPTTTLINGSEIVELDSQVLQSNLSITNAKNELGQRVANHLAYVNPAPQIDITLNPTWHFIAPNYSQWYTVVIDASKNPRNKAYTSSNRWFLTSISISTDFERGTKSVSAQLRLETSSVGFQSIESQIPLTTETPIAPQPIFSDYPSLATNALINYPTDTPDEIDLQPIDAVSSGLFNSSLPPETIAQDAQNDVPNCESLTLPMFATGSVGTSFLSTLGQAYTIEVSGDARITGASGLTRPSLVIEGGLGNSVEYDADNTRWEGLPTGGGLGAQMQVKDAQDRAFKLQNVTRANGGASALITLALAGGGSVNVGYGSDLTSYDITAVYATDSSGSVVFYFNLIPITRGDAFYTGYQDGADAQLYTSGNGLLIDGSTPTAPAYSAQHTYKLDFTGTGNQITFSYVDPDGNYGNNSLNNLYIKVCGDGIT